MRLLRPLATVAGLVGVWWAIKVMAHLPDFLLPAPPNVVVALWRQRVLLMTATATTLTETLLGLLIGTVLGAGFALAMASSPPLRRWMLPVLLLSQSVPVFALAPLVVLWFGFGIASKVVVTVVIIFFPIMAALFDGLSRVPEGWLDLARTMGAPAWRVLLRVRLPAALPSFASGLRVATTFAPIGAVIGEWVGASSGLGYVMLNANTRMQTDSMFAALVVLSCMTVGLWTLVDFALRRLIYWAPETG